MNVTMKNFQRLALAVLLLVVVVFSLNVARSKYQSFKAQQTEDQRVQEIKDITEKLNSLATNPVFFKASARTSCSRSFKSEPFK